MKVAKIAAIGAIGFAGLGVLLAMSYGDVMFLAASVPFLFVAALFLSLAEIGERLERAQDGLASAVPEISETGAEVGGSNGHVPDLAALERKLAAKRS